MIRFSSCSADCGGHLGSTFPPGCGLFPHAEAKFRRPATGNGGRICRPEDITIDAQTNTAYLSGYDRRAANRRPPDIGCDLVLRPRHPNAQLVKPDAASRRELLPHGISLYRAPDGKKTLFAINHGNNKQSVEIFDVDAGNVNAPTHRQRARLIYQRSRWRRPRPFFVTTITRTLKVFAPA